MHLVPITCTKLVMFIIYSENIHIIQGNVHYALKWSREALALASEGALNNLIIAYSKLNTRALSLKVLIITNNDRIETTNGKYSLLSSLWHTFSPTAWAEHGRRSTGFAGPNLVWLTHSRTNSASLIRQSHTDFSERSLEELTGTLQGCMSHPEPGAGCSVHSNRCAKLVQMVLHFLHLRELS
jgi:hypothetical protein